VSKKDKIKGLLNRQSGSENTEAKRELISIENIELQGNVNTKKRKKATFELELSLHTELKMFAAKEGKKMVEVVEESLIAYLKNKNI
jgi:predicted rRNA methylase YqxC with S4 and FtsJ domains